MFARRRGKLVPRTDGQAVVATKNAIAQGGTKFARDMTFVFNGEVGKTAPGVELIGRGKGFGRANIQTTLARAAVIGLGGVGRQFGRGQYRPEKQPRAMNARHQICMFALPAKSRQSGMRLLHQGRRIDEDFDVCTRAALKGPSELLDLALQDIVVIAALGVDGNGCPALIIERQQGIGVWRVTLADHDDRARLWPQDMRISAPLGGRRHP